MVWLFFFNTKTEVAPKTYIYVLANIKQQIYRDIDAYYLIHGCLQEAPLAHVEATEIVFVNILILKKSIAHLVELRNSSVTLNSTLPWLS